MIRVGLQAATTRVEDNSYHSQSHQLLFLAEFRQPQLDLPPQHSKQRHLRSSQLLSQLVQLLPVQLHLVQLLLAQLQRVSNQNKLLKEISMQTDRVAHQEEHHP